MTAAFKTAVLAAILAPHLGAQASTIFINELHYDNAGPDKGEGVEIAGAAGSDLSGYELLFYNGSNGAVYANTTLSGSIAEQQNGFGAVFFEVAGLQNGGPDGVALVDPGGAVVQFLSYEGSFVASAGAATGLSSIDIGVSEDGGGAIGASLQLIGSGTRYADFSWVAADTNSYGTINAGQTFAAVVPVPAALPLFASALAGLGLARRRR